MQFTHTAVFTVCVLPCLPYTPHH